MSKKIPITNLHYFTDWSATQSENSSIRFDFSSKIHSARAAQTAWQNRSERCWKMDDQRPSNAWTRFALGDLGGISSPKRLLLCTVIIFRPDFRLEMPPRIIVVRREVGFSTSRRMTDMDPPVPCFAIVEGYGPLWFDPKLSEICVRGKIQSYGGKQPKKQVS